MVIFHYHRRLVFVKSIPLSETSNVRTTGSSNNNTDAATTEMLKPTIDIISSDDYDNKDDPLNTNESSDKTDMTTTTIDRTCWNTNTS